jgi:uncharacterized membrane protein
MGHIRISAHCEAPIEQVFELALDVKRIPEWDPFFHEIKNISGPPGQVGTSFDTVMKVLGRPIEGHMQVTEVERPRLVTLVGVAPGGGKLTWTTRFTPAGTGTDSENEVDYELPAGFLGEMADKLFAERAIERDMKHSTENFKALVEAKVPQLA